MTEQFGEQSNPTHLADSDSLIAGKDISFYWKASRLFIVLLLILEVINIVINRIPFGTWMAVAVIAVLFTWWLLRRFRIGLATVLAANVLMGLASGLLMAIFEIVWHRQWWYVFSLIRRPILIGAAAVVAAFIFYFIFQGLINKKDIIKEPKGGGIYGGAKT